MKGGGNIVETVEERRGLVSIENIEIKFEQLYRDNYSFIRNYTYKLCGISNISEEITQEVFLKLYENLQKLKNKNIKGWLCKVAHNTVINYLKRNSKFTFEVDINLEDKSNNPEIKLEEDYNAKIISKVLNKLPKKQAMSILLRDMEGYSYEEIGNIMGISYKAVKSLIYRGRQNFIKSYREEIKK